MNRFDNGVLGEAPLLTLPQLSARGVRHGFVGKPFNFAKDHRVGSARELARALGVTEVAVLNQVHGDRILELPDRITEDPTGEGDGILFPLVTPGRSVAVGVRTADCVPLLLVGARWCAVVHAGWRGLAVDLPGKAAAAVLERDGGEEVLAVIGPCAGRDRYEVGPEVIEAIGPSAVGFPAGERKYLLDLIGTTAKQLEARGVSRIDATGVCTISDSRFHSFRRDREYTGNNFGFLVTQPG